MLGCGLGFGELGGVRIVVMEKRTFNMMLMANIRFLFLMMMSIGTCFSVDEQAAVWWILSVMKKSRLVHSIKPSLDILVAVEGWLLVCFPFELVGFVFVKLVDLLSEETWEGSFPPR